MKSKIGGLRWQRKFMAFSITAVLLIGQTMIPVCDVYGKSETKSSSMIYDTSVQSLMESYEDAYGGQCVSVADLEITGNAEAMKEYEGLFENPEETVYECFPDITADDENVGDVRIFCRGEEENAEFIFFFINDGDESYRYQIRVDEYQSGYVTVMGKTGNGKTEETDEICKSEKEDRTDGMENSDGKDYPDDIDKSGNEDQAGNKDPYDDEDQTDNTHQSNNKDQFNDDQTNIKVPDNTKNPIDNSENNSSEDNRNEVAEDYRTYSVLNGEQLSPENDRGKLGSNDTLYFAEPELPKAGTAENVIPGRTRNQVPTVGSANAESIKGTSSNSRQSGGRKGVILETVQWNGQEGGHARALIIPAQMLISVPSLLSAGSEETVRTFQEFQEALANQVGTVTVIGDIGITQGITIEYPVILLGDGQSSLTAEGIDSCLFDVYADVTLDGVNVTNRDGMGFYINDGCAINVMRGDFLTKYENFSGSGSLMLQGGTFESTEANADFEWIITVDKFEIAKGYMPDSEDWYMKNKFSIVKERLLTVLFYLEDEVYDTAEVQCNHTMPEMPAEPIDKNGGTFIGWFSPLGIQCTPNMLFTRSIEFRAVFSTSDIPVIFVDKDGSQITEQVPYGSIFGDIERFFNSEPGFAGWRDLYTGVFAESSKTVSAPCVLEAVYGVSGFNELVRELSIRSPYITVTGTIEVDRPLLIDYDVTIRGEQEDSVMIRADGLSESLITLDKAANVTLENLTVDGNHVSVSNEDMMPAIVINKYASLSLKNVIVQNNITTAYTENELSGGGICNRGKLSVYEGTRIRNNQASMGGGIYNLASSSKGVELHLYGGEITGNTAFYNGGSQGDGGGIYCSGKAFVYMDDGVIKNNACAVRGGGICLDNGEETALLVMNGGEVTDNSSGQGGGIYMGSSRMELYDGLISRNVSSGRGGGIALLGPMEDIPFYMYGGTITLNSARAAGGLDLNKAVISSGDIYDNLAANIGDDFVKSAGGITSVMNRQRYRSYASSYLSEEPLPQGMGHLISMAKPSVVVKELPDAMAPDQVQVPFYGWFYDGTEIIPTSLFPDDPWIRYSGPDGLKLPSSTNVDIDEGPVSYKAIWYGLLVLYDANHGSDETIYDGFAYLPGETVTAAPNMFQYRGYTFNGWNTSPDGNGRWYGTGSGDDSFEISDSIRLYAQWEKNKDAPIDPDNPNPPKEPEKPVKPDKPGHSGSDDKPATDPPSVLEPAIPQPAEPQPVQGAEERLASAETFTGIDPNGIPYGYMNPNGKLPQMGDADRGDHWLLLLLSAGLFTCSWQFNYKRKRKGQGKSR